MTTGTLPPQDARILIWLCRRLTGDLQAGASIARALDQAARDAPPKARPLVAAIRKRVAAGGRVSEQLADLRLPSWVWGAVRHGEARGDLACALEPLAAEIEFEQATPAPSNRQLYQYSLAFRRMGMLLTVGVPILEALEAAAESVDDRDVSRSACAVRKAVLDGGAVSDALAGEAPNLPPMTIEMIRDAESDGRLDQALPVVADYLLEAASEKPTRRHRPPNQRANKEVSNA